MMRRAILLLATMALTVLVASGVALAVTKIGTNGPDHLRGTNGADTLIGKGGNDILNALAGYDNLVGGRGKDVVVGGRSCCDLGDFSGGDKNLLGGSGNDAVIGGLGADNVVGGAGNDLVTDGPDREFSTDILSAGDGNDVVGVFNDPAFKDIVTCGGGFDRVFADKKDLVASDCERVADTPSEFEQLANSIPESFDEGLPPSF
jgi:Ca2+-binding RTX toxin-like protein